MPYAITAALVRDVTASGCEAVFVSCTNLPTYDIVAPLEAELGIPVLTANQVTMWACPAPHRPGRRRSRPVPAGGGMTARPPPTTARSGDEAAAPFTDAEFAARLGRVQRVMAERSLAALVVADPANIYYLSGYNAWSFYTPQCLVVPATGLPHLFARAMDAQGGHYTAYLGHDHIHGYPEHLVHRPDAHPLEWIADRAQELGLIEDTFGVEIAAETDAPFFSARGFLALRSHLRHAALVDSRELVNWVRVVKSPAEQEKMRVAGAIAERVMATALDAVTPGRRQCDVVCRHPARPGAGTPTLGGDYPAVVPMLPTGETAGTPHLTWGDAPFVVGEATTIELAGVHHRYHAPLARTVSLGKPPRRLAELRRHADRGHGGTLWRHCVPAAPATPCMRPSPGHQPERPDQGVPHRLLHRCRIPAGLGRAHRQPARRRRARRSRRAWPSTSSSACGWTAGAMRPPNRYWSPKEARSG